MTEEQRKQKKIARDRYRASEKGKATEEAYVRLPKTKAKKAAREKLPHMKASRKRKDARRWENPKARACTLYYGCVRRAKKHGFPCAPKEEFLRIFFATRDRCAVTRDQFDYTKSVDGRFNPYAPSADQKIPGKGYGPENLQFVVAWYNRMKGDRTDQEARRILRNCGVFLQLRLAALYRSAAGFPLGI